LPELGENPAVAMVSLGAEREFVLRHGATEESLTYRPRHGSLLVMAGTVQHHWLHSLPQTEQPVRERISLTFRFIKETPASGAA
jgi:alkylated DNA repair dioxygenase AlkB